MKSVRSSSVNMDSLRLPPPPPPPPPSLLPPPPPSLLPPPPPPFHANRRNTLNGPPSHSSVSRSYLRSHITRSPRLPFAGPRFVEQTPKTRQAQTEFPPPPPPPPPPRITVDRARSCSVSSRITNKGDMCSESTSLSDIDIKRKPQEVTFDRGLAETSSLPPASSVQNKVAKKRHAGKDSALDTSIAGLPKELVQKFGPLKCDLCSVSVNSTVQAKMHYAGKLHEKKVNGFLANWKSETGEPVPKMIKNDPPQKKQLDGKFSFCEICNLVFTSFAHATQHYMGRNHRRAAAGRATVMSNVDNMKKGADDPTGRFGIGAKFQPWANTDPLGLSETSDVVKSKNFFCELCKVTATSRDQLDTHFGGAKHRKAEAASMNKPVISAVSTTSNKQPDSILASVIQNDEGAQKLPGKDYSIYRTPSGHYYCQPCNLTLNSEAQFIQHCFSKKHKFKLATSKKPTNKPVKGTSTVV